MLNIALILAAGDGKRLDRSNTPKPLVKVAEIPIVIRLIDQMQAQGINEIYLVVGYERHKIIQTLNQHYVNHTDLHLHFVENINWQNGMISSLKLALSEIHNQFGDQQMLLSMGDHLFAHEHLPLLLSKASQLSEDELMLLVDPRLSETDATVITDAVKVTTQANDQISDLGFQLSAYQALDMGLFIIRPNQLLGTNQNSLVECMQVIAKAQKLKACAIQSGEWFDIDTPVDLIHAEMAFRRAKRASAVKKPNPQHDLFGQYEFVAGKPEITQMIVGRGIFKDPSKIDLIPMESASSPIFIFTDETVSPLYAQPLQDRLNAYGYRTHLIVMAEGEESKTLSNYVRLTEKVLSLGVDERSVFISVGGGVVCNVCGFIASTIYRGLDLVHLPTTLMAQADAAISHKQAINGHLGKNMVGAYYSPRMVAVDVEALLTLDERLIKDGMAEVIKHALCKDRAYVELLLEHKGDFIKDLDLLEEVIRRNVAHKCLLSKEDPKELSAGMALQYGHTIGHPIEHLSGYSLYHGESVAIGMMVEARVSKILGGCGQELVDLHERLLQKFGLPTQVPAYISNEDMIKTLRYNKRYLTEGTRMALLSDVGEMWHVKGDYVIPVPLDVLVEAFEQTKAKA
jgi:3-dehydroquinate synthase